MNPTRSKPLLRLALVVLAAGIAQAQRPAIEVAAVTAFVHVDVLPMGGAEPARGQTVLVRGDRIVAVGSAAEIAVPEGARIVDGAGATLLPGLVDMHVHLPADGSRGEPGDAAWRVLSTMAAHGVTTARGLAGHAAHPELRERVLREALFAPTLYVAAPALHDGNTKTAEAARDAVRAAHEARFDLVKSHQLTDVEVWRAVQSAARELGLPVSGHVTNEVGLAVAIQAGQQLEHLDGFTAALLPKDANRTGWSQFPTAAALELVQRGRIDTLAKLVAASGVYSTPTLALFERVLDLETPTDVLRARPGMAYVSPVALEAWSSQCKQMRQAGVFAAIAEPYVALRRDLVLALHRAGAPLLAGSDSPQSFLMPGPALVDELEALVRAGLTPLAALETATSVPASYFAALPRNGSANGTAVDFGRIAVGLRADLVLVAGDPSRNIGALRDVQGVMVRGQWKAREALDPLLAQLERAAKGLPLNVGREAAGPVIYLVRHAEAGPEKPDPELTEAGVARAEQLAERLESSGVERILSSDYARTRSTAGAVAERLGLEVELYDPRELENLARELRTAIGRILVVGHSNTTPALFTLLTGEETPPIAEAEHDRLYRIDVATGETVLERFGAAAAR